MVFYSYFNYGVEGLGEERIREEDGVGGGAAAGKSFGDVGRKGKGRYRGGFRGKEVKR